MSLTSNARKIGYMLTEETKPFYTKINSKCIKDLNIWPDTVKVLKENIENIMNTLQDITIGNDFLEKTPTPRHRQLKQNWTNEIT